MQTGSVGRMSKKEEESKRTTRIFFGCSRVFDVNQRAVTNPCYSLILGIRLCAASYFLPILLATSWPKLRLAIIDCMF